METNKRDSGGWSRGWGEKGRLARRVNRMGNRGKGRGESLTERVRSRTLFICYLFLLLARISLRSLIPRGLRTAQYWGRWVSLSGLARRGGSRFLMFWSRTGTAYILLRQKREQNNE
jgi:hypothetical protein